MADIGLSFSPTAAQTVQGPYAGTNKGGGVGSVSPVQDAIRILSFRLPSVLGALAPTAAQNLGQTALGGQIGGALQQNYLNYALSGLTPQSFSGPNPNPPPAYGFQNFLSAANGGMPANPSAGFSAGGGSAFPSPPASGLPVGITLNQPRPGAAPAAPTFGAGTPLGGPGAFGGGKSY